MNNFAELIFVEQHRKVTYYSVALNNESALYDQFVEKHMDKNRDRLNHIQSWLKVIGDSWGAEEFYFRNEAKNGSASALPPSGKDREPVYLEYSEERKNGIATPNNLRLYCFRANKHVVFLFNGDIKRAKRAQDCENVREHFEMANLLSRLLDKAFIQQEIRWTRDFTDIIVDDDFILEWD